MTLNPTFLVFLGKGRIGIQGYIALATATVDTFDVTATDILV